MVEDKISVRVEKPIEDKAGLPRLGKTTAETLEIGTESLSESLKNFISRVQKILEEQQGTKSSFYIDEVELTLSVNASGGIELVGKLETGVTGGIKIKLKRSKSKV